MESRVVAALAFWRPAPLGSLWEEIDEAWKTVCSLLEAAEKVSPE